MRRCTKCVLPENYPGITFNDEGICHYCSTYQEIKYLGEKALRREIESYLRNKKDRNKDYDCVLGLSGGRDSTYLLYYLTEILNLRVLAYSADNGFIPEQTKLNMKNATEILNIRLVIEKHDLLKECLKHTVSSWMRRPSLPMVETFCTGCRLGTYGGTFHFAIKNKIPVVFGGGTPFEIPDYRMNMLKINPNGGGFSAILGYLSHIIRNPRWIMNHTYFITQIKEYLYVFHTQRLISESDLLRISPFKTYFRWNEKEVISTIENKLKWQKNPHMESTWRVDCDIVLLKMYVYEKVLGFSDWTDGYSQLIRDNQISREDALERLDKEGEIPEKVINGILDDLGLDYSDFKNCVIKCARQYK